MVFAASSLTDAFDDLAQKFQATYPSAKVTLNYGASTALRTQLEQGAKADVFASANQAEMDKAKQAGAIGGADKTFAAKIETLKPGLLEDGANNPGRKFNWRFREPSMLGWYLANAK